MTIHHDWDKTEVTQLTGLNMPQMAWFTPEAGAQVRGMPLSKRLFDITFAMLLLLPVLLLMGIVTLALLISQGRPIFYSASRLKAPNQSFTQWKFRTMLRDDSDFGATGAHKHWRITPFGHFLRRSRIDELPQLYNILKGDMSFVGPRPPLKEYVDRFPMIYNQVLKSRPGVTGLATLIYHRREDQIMSECRSAGATEAAYYRRCLPAKLKLDLIYQRHMSLGMDLWILWNTMKIVITHRDERPRRRGRK